MWLTVTYFRPGNGQNPLFKMHYSGHFQSYHLLLLVIYGTAGAPNRVFSCASSFSMVNGFIETKIWRKIEKKT